jgi:signal transduction histidine kinase
VKQVIEAHGGEVSVASIEGVGTSMVLRLPVKRVAA